MVTVAVKEFLRYSSDYWKRSAPNYLLLVRDANWNYRGKLGYGVKNYAPTYHNFVRALFVDALEIFRVRIHANVNYRLHSRGGKTYWKFS